MAGIIILLAAGVAVAAKTELVSVEVVDGSRDDVTSEKCLDVGPIATSSSGWAVLSGLVGGSDCDDMEHEFVILKLGNESWEVTARAKTPEHDHLPILVSLSDGLGTFGAVWNDGGSYVVAVYSEIGTKVADGSMGSDEPAHLLILSPLRYALSYGDDSRVRVASADGDDIGISLSGIMTATEFMAYDRVENAIYVGGNVDDGTGRRGVARLDLASDDGDGLTVAWTTAVDVVVGSPRLLLRRGSGAAATEVLLVSTFFYARVDAATGEILLDAEECDVGNADLVAYDVVSDKLVAYDDDDDDGKVEHRSIGDCSVLRFADVSKQVEFASPAANRREYGWSVDDGFFEGDWWLARENDDDDGEVLAIVVVPSTFDNTTYATTLVLGYWIGTIGKDVTYGNWYDWFALSVDRREFEYGDVGFVRSVYSNGYSSKPGVVADACGDSLAVTANQNEEGVAQDGGFFIYWISLADNNVVWKVDVKSCGGNAAAPELISVNEVFEGVAVYCDDGTLSIFDKDGEEVAVDDIGGDVQDLELLDDGRVVVSRGDDAEIELMEGVDDDDVDAVTTVDFSGIMTATEFMAYDRVESAIYVGGNVDDGTGRRGVSRLDYDAASHSLLSLSWTTAVEATRGSPRVLIRADTDEAATEILLVSSYFYARVNASTGEASDVFDPDFVSSNLVAYDTFADALYGYHGEVVERYDVLTGQRKTQVAVSYILDVDDPDDSDIPLPDDDDADDQLDNWYKCCGKREVVGLFTTTTTTTTTTTSESSSHVHAVGYYEGGVYDEDNYLSLFVLELDKYQEENDDEKSSFCEDSTSWHRRDAPLKNCDWVADYKSSRCSSTNVDANGVSSEDACAFSCGACVVDGCEDSTSWFVKGQPEKTCSFINEASKNRCKRFGDGQVYAYDACRAACGTCLIDCDSDSESWHKRSETSKDCKWVADKANTRCLVKGEDDSRGFEGCPAACGLCFS